MAWFKDDVKYTEPKTANSTVDVFHQGGIYISPAQINELSQFFGGSLVSSYEDLKRQLAVTQQARLSNGIDIQLTTDDLMQLGQQALGMGIPIDQYVKEFVEDAISLQLNGCVVPRGW